MAKKEPYSSSLFDCVNAQHNTDQNSSQIKKTAKALVARNFLPDGTGLILQQDSINDFKSMRRDFWERFLNNKICIFLALTMNILVKYTGIPTFVLKIKNMSFYMYSILAQAA